VFQEMTRINFRRLYYISIIAVPVHLLHIIFFSIRANSETQQIEKWRIGILTVHSVQMTVMSALFLMFHFLKKRELPLRLLGFIEAFVFLIFLLTAVTLVSIDQLVTTNITPYLVLCTVVGVVLLMRPVQSFILYIASYFSFYFGIGFYQTDSVILLTNRVNGISITAVGICISVLLWISNRKNLLQNRKILRQRKELTKKNAELKAVNAELEKLSIIDELTLIYNRRYFNRVLLKEISRHYRSKRPISLLICDIDFFKNYNDSLGHISGDHCLRIFGEVLKESLFRPFDICARYGGEEFAVILPETDEIGAQNIAERILYNLRERKILHPSSLISSYVTASIGAVTLVPETETNDFELVNKADLALYRSKTEGRNRICRFE
ncbi:MAG TPA: GGDEF domain-containing protein, partial [Leptospiraceae bacterium]|nr:GGDEF domain-containing protein [Leptospiraceae bacterium]